jgi:hypothetical protein
MDELGYENTRIAALAGVVALVIGSFLLGDASEGVQGTFGMGCMFGAIALRHLLDGRKLRRLEREKAGLPR